MDHASRRIDQRNLHGVPAHGQVADRDGERGVRGDRGDTDGSGDRLVPALPSDVSRGVAHCDLIALSAVRHA